MKLKTKNTHFTIETRMIIEEELDKGTSVTNISKKLFRDRSNIGREIDKQALNFQLLLIEIILINSSAHILIDI